MSKKSPKYKAVIFDFGGVIAGEIEEKLKKLTPDVEKFLGIMREGGEYSISSRMMKGFISVEEGVRLACECYHHKYDENFDPGKLIPKGMKLNLNQPVIDAVKALKCKGYVTAICSNNMRYVSGKTCLNDAFEKEPQLELSDFDVIIDSCEVHLEKPYHDIFYLTLGRISKFCAIQPGEAIFLDDFAENIKGAKEVGLECIDVSPCKEEAIKQLEELLDEDLKNGS